MRINDQCLPCLVNQAIKIAKLCGLKERDELYREVFSNLSTIDFSKTNPEIIGQNYQIIKRFVGLDDPYKENLPYHCPTVLPVGKGTEIAQLAQVRPVIFGSYLPGINLQFSADRDIIKKSVFQVSGQNALPDVEKRFLFG